MGSLDRGRVLCAGFDARWVRVDDVAVFIVHKRSIIDLFYNTYRNLQRHRAVHQAIARLSCNDFF